MVSRAGGYYGPPFKGYRRVTQGDLISPTLFNVFVDAIICLWVRVVAAIEAGMEGLGLSIRDLTDYSYSDDEIFASTQPERMQRLFRVLVGLFGRVDIRKNTWKTGSMDCQPWHMPGMILVVVYESMTKGVGPT